MHERAKRSGRTGGGEQTITTGERRHGGARERLRGMSFAEQEEALRPEPEPEGKKKSKGLGGALKKIFGKKKDKAPKAAPLEMEIGGPTDVQRVPQPLERVMAHLGTDPEVAKLVRFDGMTLKLDRSALPQPDAETQVDPTKPKVGIPTPDEVLDVSTLPPARSALDGKAENGGVNGYVVRATTKDGRAVVVKRPYVIYFPGEYKPQVYPISGDVDRAVAARMLAGPEAAGGIVDVVAAGKAKTKFNGSDGREFDVEEDIVVLGALEETLKDRAARDGGMSAKDAKRHGTTLLKVLRAMERAGLAHNDLKSDNMMFDANGELVLIDFGEMSSRDGVFPSATGATSTWAPNYENETGAKKDSWAAGINMIAMLTGEVTSEVGGPFSNCESQAEVDALLDEVFAALAEKEDDEGSLAGLESTIRGLMRYDEDERSSLRRAHKNIRGG